MPLDYDRLISKLGTTQVVAQASESLEEQMISDKKLSKLVDELNSHFTT